MTHSMKKGKMLYDPILGECLNSTENFHVILCSNFNMIIKHLQQCGKMYAVMEKRNINLSVVYKHDYQN